MSGPLAGLARGLAVTLRTLTRHAVTAEYPDVAPALPPRTRGVIALLEENCTVCMLCARECPDWCIYIDSHKESIHVEGAARARQRNVLDRFDIDFSLCMYCGICIEVCPFDALFWSPQFEYSSLDIADLTHEKERLREWMWTVPPPPALDPAAPQPKELAAPTRPARPARPARSGPSATGGPPTAGGPAATAEPAAARRATAKPASTEPATAKPASAEPATGEPSTVKPSTVKPESATPATAKPAGQPAARSAEDASEVDE